MERYKMRFGWRCVLSAEEVEYSQGDMILRDDIYKWQINPDGTAILRVYPWMLHRIELMELFIEGLGEGGFPTENIIRKGDVDIVDREY